MTVEHTCPICGDARQLSFLCNTDGADVFTCATCGGDHVYPPPPAGALKAYYDRAAWFEGGEKGGYENYDAQTSTDVLNATLAPFAGKKDLSILDVGCGYGTHLAAAAKQGWKCFGVEPSAHARKVAQERLGGNAFIVENVGDVIPHPFDVVLLLDVIEHLPAPYPTLYQLFSIGAITPETMVVITTPNAGSAAARRDPAAWPYRHPASHLVHYSARALEFLLRRLHFNTLDVRETGPEGDGLWVTAKGSDFTEFMRERYVPGTWSKLAEYEHLPRYALAKTLAAGKAVLDFGCGTGYGAAIMADVATAVTGLDIDASALAWAESNHRNPRLKFCRHDDLGASLPAEAFDLVTCFEMIEHVDFKTQQAAVASMARMLRGDGMLVISTPNPDVTALYGANPYHIREMNEAELRELLSPHFPHIEILRQYVRVGVAIDHPDAGGGMVPGDLNAHTGAKPLAFLAVCARRPLPALPSRILFDQETDYISQFTAAQQALNNARFAAYQTGEQAQSLSGQLDQTVRDLRESQNERARVEHTLETTTAEFHARMQEAQAHLQTTQAQLHETHVQWQATQAQLQATHAHLQATTDAFQELRRIREEELSSPRFLARQLWQATRARIRAKLSGK
jgi:2-polyprenyl-3-methyl-5-hydroxy-6-metoxy-1,4-benzoquinol methylase